MARYFDSSVLLSLVVGDARGARAQALWTEEPERIGSTLLEVECLTVLRRVLRRGAAATAAGERLSMALEEVSLKPLDEDILAIVRSTPALAGCRSLDAVHVATALFFNVAAEGELRFCTFDERMAEVAARLGLRVDGGA